MLGSELNPVVTEKDSKKKALIDELTDGSTICNDSDVYLVEQLLGRGSFGLVSKCLKNESNQRVALKVMRKEEGYSAIQELEAVISLRAFNPDQINIVTSFDWFLYEDHYCFTYELLDRTLLDFMIQREWSPLKVSEIRAITKQMLVSLTALEQLQMTHTDIKIDNIMLVDHVSTPFRVKLIDFGLCRLTSDLTELDIIQAPIYRAPEVYLAFSQNEAVDMWGLGCSLGVLYLGRLMFPGGHPYEILRSIFNLVGQPDKHVLDKAPWARCYFTLDQTDSTWRFKSAKQYQEETGFIVSEETSKLQSLDDLVEMASCVDNSHEVQDVREFIDLLKKMLAVNPGDRIRPSDALKHNFVTMKHLPISTCDSYVNEAFKIMSQCQSIPNGLPVECESSQSHTSLPNPTMAPPQKECQHKKSFRELRKYFARIFNTHHVLRR